jgi:hypothetical protein
MLTVTTIRARRQRRTELRTSVVRASLLGCGSFTTGVGSILIIAGRFNISDGLARYAITVAGIIAALAQLTAAICVLQKGESGAGELELDRRDQESVSLPVGDAPPAQKPTQVPARGESNATTDSTQPA